MTIFRLVLNSNKLCLCGCGNHSKVGRTYINGHNRRGKTHVVSSETREKMSEAMRTPENIERQRNRQLGKKHTEEAKEKISKARLGKKHSDETKEKMGLSHLGNAYNLGRKHTEEAKEKMSAANLGRKHSEETKEKIQKSLLGRIFSDETKEKMRIAQNKPEAIERNKTNIIKLLEAGKIGWNGKESYPERIFREFLESMGYIKGVGFFQNYRVGTYSLDFAFLDDKRYVEIDGGQHLKEKAIEHDKKRDIWFQSQGWVGIRIPAKELNEFLYMALCI